MNSPRILYRTRQFWHTLRASPTPMDLEQVRAILDQRQMALFYQMQPSEQAHSIKILRELSEKGEDNPDLRVAALLHDAGKSRLPLRAWERALVVVGKAIAPRLAQRWGTIPAGAEEKIPSWRRAFVVAVMHPQWGAEMAAQAGASPLAVALIRRHQENLDRGNSETGPHSLEDRLLRKLQASDDKS